MMYLIKLSYMYSLIETHTNSVNLKMETRMVSRGHCRENKNYLNVLTSFKLVTMHNYSKQLTMQLRVKQMIESF